MWMLVMVLFVPQGVNTTVIPFQDEAKCKIAVEAILNDPTRTAPWSGICVKMPEPTPPITGIRA